MRILVAEDDAAPASFVKKGLEAEHYAMDIARLMANKPTVLWETVIMASSCWI